MTWGRIDEAQHYGGRILEGRRVRFRALEDQDLSDLVRWWRDPAWAVLQQIIVRPRVSEDVAEQFRSWSKSERSGEVGFSVVDKVSEQLVGHVTLFGAKIPTRAATLAVMIGSEHVDRGYGTDAVRVLTDYGFREMGLNRIEIQVLAVNERARNVYRRVGYVEEGVRRDSVFHDGCFHDQVILSALAGEWLGGVGRP